MAQPVPRFRVEARDETRSVAVREVRASSPRPVGYWILYVGFTVLPIIAGADKFFHYLVNWDQYLSAPFANALGGNVPQIMLGVGVVEIVAGILVALAPQIGAYVVTLWLWGIIVNLLSIPGYFDIALRDFGLSLGALALAQFSQQRRISTTL